MRTLAFDFETYYDDEKSVRPLGARTYFDSLSLDEIYLVTVASDDGYRFAGHPKDLDWSILEGAIALNHNAGFDQEGVRRLRELGVKIPEPAELHDTADLAAYCGYPRALAGISHILLNKILNKNVRDKDMKGKQWRDMDPDLRKAVSDYAIEDAVVTLEVWQKLSPRWPAEERLISRLSREWAAEGIAVDLPLIESSIEKLKATIWEAERTIPWVVNDNLKPLSPKALALECRKVGIVPPTSLAMDSEECDAWLDEHGEKYPWVMSMRNWRRANAILKKLEAMKVRTVKERMRYGIKYWGAGMTGRWSGDAGVNVQNLSGRDLYGVNMREHLVAEPGHVLIAADLAQIEPRWTCCFTGESEALAQMAAGVSPYIVYARQAMGLGPNEEWPKSDPRYKIAKVSVLGAGYCAGHHRFIDVMRAYEVEDLLDGGPENPDTPEAYLEYLEAVGKPDWLKIWREASELEKLRLMRSWEIIMTFRNGRPKLTALWKELGDLAKMSAARGEDLVLGLPSGRDLVYKKCRSRREPRNPEDVDMSPKMSIVADIIRNGQPQTTRIHQGILIENLCQSAARDTFRDCLINVHEAGYKIIFHVHDELIVEVPKHKAEAAKEDIERIMGIPPKWAKTLPVAAEATIAERYSEAK